MQFDPSLILLYLAPMFLAFIAWEWWYLQKHASNRAQAQDNTQNGIQNSAQYSISDTASNAALALMHELGKTIAAVVVISVYGWFFDYRMFDIPTNIFTIALLFLLQDFCYYWFHRTSHVVRWMWASHVVHHSSEKLNLSTAFRQSMMYPVSGMWVFWLPLIALGFSPDSVITVVLISLAYQFFVHTQVVDKIGPLESILNTPSHHRVHHAKNPRYIDKNFAGVLIIWDKIFGTFEPEDPAEPCIYGIPKQIRSHNPILLTFHEWKQMFADMREKHGWKAKIRELLGRPY
ncbi:Uncharacterised protein [BD1-7 clade bacterium]|uniref:Fatty acid hydroxylase domain-containing protein n=1 Tax=BD1-7 clade bacterium TaxID=2029982 RepID=A0A5S9NMU7_9GAMM|nr:Uncharacterised protein [BD1-7 clade bacterium]CAA0093432.1 Uncharacterised protein [BD1-7 clade bacterium]